VRNKSSFSFIGTTWRRRRKLIKAPLNVTVAAGFVTPEWPGVAPAAAPAWPGAALASAPEESGSTPASLLHLEYGPELLWPSPEQLWGYYRAKLEAWQLHCAARSTTWSCFGPCSGCG
jgi:hypothetical protein